jgi:hypothetical protein
MFFAPKLPDVVALLEDIPAEGLYRGEVGTVVEVFDDACEIEFVDNNGQTSAILPLRFEQFVVLRLARTPLDRSVDAVVE